LLQGRALCEIIQLVDFPDAQRKRRKGGLCSSSLLISVCCWCTEFVEFHPLRAQLRRMSWWSVMESINYTDPRVHVLAISYNSPTSGNSTEKVVMKERRMQLTRSYLLYISNYLFIQVNLNWTELNWTELNSIVWVRERTIPTERPPLVGEVIANFCR
jgi:hypothetical protein